MCVCVRNGVFQTEKIDAVTLISVPLRDMHTHHKFDLSPPPQLGQVVREHSGATKNVARDDGQDPHQEPGLLRGTVTRTHCQLQSDTTDSSSFCRSVDVIEKQIRLVSWQKQMHVTTVQRTIHQLSLLCMFQFCFQAAHCYIHIAALVAEYLRRRGRCPRDARPWSPEPLCLL